MVKALSTIALSHAAMQLDGMTLTHGFSDDKQC
jgi:hypothetical protein